MMRAVAVLSISAGTAACGGLATDPAEEMRAPLGSPAYSYFESFESGFGGWTPLDASVVRSSSRAADGAFSVVAISDADSSGGAIWLERTFSIQPPKKDRYRVTIAFRVWSEVRPGTSPAPVLAYLGDDDPTVAADFTTIGRTAQVEGWKDYSLSRTVTFEDGRPLYAAIGLGVSPTSARSHFIDQVSVIVE